jgi:hypothetical protein
MLTCPAPLPLAPDALRRTGGGGTDRVTPSGTHSTLM